MRHLIFPTKQQADAFVQDLRAQGVIQPEVGSSTLNRGAGAAGRYGAGATSTANNASYAANTDDAAQEAGDGAVAGTGVGAAVGAAAGVVAALIPGGVAAVPVILGMTALGSGVGAGAGAIAGAADADARTDYTNYSSDVSDAQYDRLSEGSSGGRAIAVEDSVPEGAVNAAAARHGGEFV